MGAAVEWSTIPESTSHTWTFRERSPDIARRPSDIISSVCKAAEWPYICNELMYKLNLYNCKFYRSRIQKKIILVILYLESDSCSLGDTFTINTFKFDMDTVRESIAHYSLNN